MSVREEEEEEAEVQLLKWVYKLRMGVDLSLEVGSVKRFLLEELQVPTEQLPRPLRDALPSMVAVFMRKWPYLHLVKNDKVALDYVAELLRRYLKMKVLKLIRKQFRRAVASEGDAEEAPFGLSVTCPAHLVNSLFFVGSGEDVVMQCHKARRWTDLSTAQLINWPHVEVNFHSVELSFSRRMATTCARFLASAPVSSGRSDDGSAIENVQCAPSAAEERQCFTRPLIRAYIKEYLEIIKLTTDIPAENYEEIDTVLKNFVTDLSGIQHDDSVATCTSITLRLGDASRYSRVKGIPKSMEKASIDHHSRVTFWEFFEPKVEFCLNSFRAEQENCAFVCLVRMKKGLGEAEIIPTITYRCTFCDKAFKSKSETMRHFRNCHAMEENLHCAACNTNLDFVVLAGNRWVHECAKMVVVDDG